MSQVAITGATGFIGQTLTHQLTQAGHQVKCLAREPSRLKHPSGPEVIAGDITDPNALIALVQDVDAVIHLAGATAARSRSDYFRTNAAGTTILCDALCAHAPNVRLVHVSSLAARQPHLSDYAASKEASEQVVQHSGLSWVIVRPPAVIGQTDQALKPLWQGLARGWLPRLGPAEARFSLLHVDDLCDDLNQLLEPAAFQLATHHIIEVDDHFCAGDERGYGWTDIAQIGQTVFNRAVTTLPVPKELLYFGALLAQMGAQFTKRPPLLNWGKVRELRYPQWVASPPAWLKDTKSTSRRQLRDTLRHLI